MTEGRRQYTTVRDLLSQEAGISVIAKETGLTRQTIYRIKEAPLATSTIFGTNWRGCNSLPDASQIGCIWARRVQERLMTGKFAALPRSWFRPLAGRKSNHECHAERRSRERHHIRRCGSRVCWRGPSLGRCNCWKPCENGPQDIRAGRFAFLGAPAPKPQPQGVATPNTIAGSNARKKHNCLHLAQP